MGRVEQWGHNCGLEMLQRPLIRLAQHRLIPPRIGEVAKVCMVCLSQNNAASIVDHRPRPVRRHRQYNPKDKVLGLKL